MAELPVITQAAVEELQASQKDNRERLQKSLRGGLLNVTNAIKAMHETLKDAFDLDKKQAEMEKIRAGLQLEQERERMRKEQEQRQKKDKKPSSLKLPQFSLTGAALGALAVLVFQYWDQVSAAFEKIQPLLASMASGLMEIAEVIIPFLLDNIDIIAGGILGVYVAMKVWQGISLLSSAVTSLTTGLGSLSGKINTLSNNLRGANTNLGDDPGGSANRRSRGIGSKLKDLGRSFAGLGVAIAGLGTAIAPILVPIAVAVGIALAIANALRGIVIAFDDALAAFEETGSIAEAIQVGMSSLFANIVGFPLNLIKDLISWGARTLGFEQFADQLDSFDFVEFLKTQVKSLLKWFYDPETESIFGGKFDLNSTTLFEDISTEILLLPARLAAKLYDSINKNVIVPILKYFGFEETAKKFEEVSFSDLVDKIVEKVKGWIKDLKEAILDFIPDRKEIVSDLKNSWLGRQFGLDDKENPDAKKGMLDIPTPDALKGKLKLGFDDDPTFVPITPKSRDGAAVQVKSEEAELAKGAPSFYDNSTVAPITTNNSTINRNSTTVTPVAPQRKLSAWATRGYKGDPYGAPASL